MLRRLIEPIFLTPQDGQLLIEPGANLAAMLASIGFARLPKLADACAALPSTDLIGLGQRRRPCAYRAASRHDRGYQDALAGSGS
jgi:hypothetical protein